METAQRETFSDGVFELVSATASVALFILLALFSVLLSTLWSGSAS
jgi:hypothetical protein